MNKPVVQLGPDAVKQVAKTVREYARRIVNEKPTRQRWQQMQPNQGCTPSYDLRLLWNPTAATMSIDVKYNAVTETISIGLNDDETDVQTAVDAHSEFVIDDVHCTATSAGGFPHSNILLTLPPGASIVTHAATLTRRDGSPTPEFRVDICGCSA